MLNRKTIVLSIVVTTLLTTGCSQTKATPETTKATSKTISQKTSTQTISDGSFTLPNAKSGMCYGKVIVPAQYKTVSEKIMVTPKGQRVSIVPAEYKMAQERILDVAASTRIVAIPAAYKTESKTVTVSPAYSEWRTGLHPEARVASGALLSAAKAGGINLETTKSGSCYYEFYSAPQFKSTTEKVLDTAVSSRIVTKPAMFKVGTKKILVTPESTKLTTLPAVYKTVTEKVQTAPAKKVWQETKCEDKDCAVEEMMCLVDIPATYNTITKQVLVTAETTKSVTIPAVYKTIQINELATPATTKKVAIPATYKTLTKTEKVSNAKYVWSDSLAEKVGMERTSSVICKVTIPAISKVITKQVVATPASSKTVTIPASYKTVEVTKIVKQESTQKTVIPAVYKTVSKQVKVSDQSVKWMPVLCKSSMTIETISNIQRALTTAGFKTPVTGSLDAATKASVEAYQTKKGLIVSGLSIATLKDLGVL